MTAKRLVISAVNFSEGGPLSILNQSLGSASEFFGPDWEIIALVHDSKLINSERARCIEFPKSKSSWIRRMYLEWIYFKKLSKNLRPDFWLSLHDITPNVKAKRQAVYCHNPAPFYRLGFREALVEPKFVLFNWFYSWLYRININKNYAVIVQQQWLREAFSRLYGHGNIIVAHPNLKESSRPESQENALRGKGKTIFLYPAFPRVFKNFEIVCEAVSKLEESILDKIQIKLTIDGSENRYANSIVKRYKKYPAIDFIGLQPKASMEKLYSSCNAVLFPSKLETWGLPITEGKLYGKRLLVADLPYAHETVGDYELVKFIHPDDAKGWRREIEAIASGSFVPQTSVASQPAAPYAKNWGRLWELLTEGL